MRRITRSILTLVILAAPLAQAMAAAAIVFTDQQRASVESWYTGQRGKSCPPGLAKKNNGCLPPGQAKKRYTVGKPLPAGIALKPLPEELSRRIGAAPTGYIYAEIDGDLLKLAAGTLLVIDAIQGLSK
jgi:hypothetical protein